MEIRKRLALNIRRIRVSQNVSQEKLAADAGIDRAYLGGIERREQNPTIDVIVRIATALQIDVSQLLTKPQRDEKMAALAPGRKQKL